jgi:hypothetical protein
LGFSILFLFVLVGWSRYFCFALFASIAFSPLFLTLLRLGLVSWLTCVLSFPFSHVSLRLSVLFLLTVFGYAMLPSGVVRGRKTAGLVALWLRLGPMGHLYSFSCGVCRVGILENGTVLVGVVCGLLWLEDLTPSLR